MMDHHQQKRFCSVSEKFKVETFHPILDTLIFELTKRAEAYSQIGNLFSFFSEFFKKIAFDALMKV